MCIKKHKSYPHTSNEDDYLYESARVFQVLGKYKEAIDLYNKVIENYPQSTHAKESDFFIFYIFI